MTPVEDEEVMLVQSNPAKEDLNRKLVFLNC